MSLDRRKFSIEVLTTSVLGYLSNTNTTFYLLISQVVNTSCYGPERCLTMMIDSMPYMANMLLDKCVTIKGTKDHPDDYEVMYDFFCLESKGN